MNIDCLTECPVPGACCRGFAINQLQGRSDAEIAEGLRANQAESLRLIGRVEAEGAMIPVFVCDAFDHKTGKCTDYENRPHLCREYEPGRDSLCAAFCGPPKYPEFQRSAQEIINAYHERTTP